MEQHADAKDVDMSDADDQVPQEIACRHGLNQATGSRISIHSLDRCHVLPLLVDKYHPQRQDRDEGTLREGDDMDIPAELRALREIRIKLWEKPGRDPGCDNGLDELVQGEREDDFMYMVWQRRQGPTLCDRRNQILKPSWRRRYRIQHYCWQYWRKAIISN